LHENAINVIIDVAITERGFLNKYQKFSFDVNGDNEGKEKYRK
jgi:hypothetical protein